MPHYTEDQAIASLVTLYTEAAPTAVVFPFWALSAEKKKWPAQMVSDAAGGKTYGYVMTYLGSPGIPPSERIHGGVRSQRIWNFEICGLHWHDEETDTGAAFRTDTRKVRETFDRESSAVLTFPESLKLVDSFAEDFTVIPVGNVLLHLYVASLSVRQC
jgi:hypothetical protein